MARAARNARDVMSSEPADRRIEAIAERIAELDLISAIRWIDACFPDAPRPGAALGIADEPLRLSQPVKLGFNATSLASLAPRKGRARGRHDWRLQCNWLGLFGSNGALPMHFTEYADRRTRHHADPTFREFLDLFNHRVIGLFYGASVQFDPVVNGDKPGSNVFEGFLGAVAGRLPDAAHGRDALADRYPAFQAGWFGARSRTPDGLQALVGEYLGLPCRVQEFVGGWLALPSECRVRLGRPDGTQPSGRTSVALGRSSLIGRRAWSIGHAMTLRLGPLDRDDYRSLRPGGARARLLHDLVRNYLGDELDWSVELELDPTVSEPLRFDGRAVLGFTSWLGDRRLDRGRQVRRIPARVCARGPIRSEDSPLDARVGIAPTDSRREMRQEQHDDPFDALDKSFNDFPDDVFDGIDDDTHDNGAPR